MWRESYIGLDGLFDQGKPLATDYHHSTGSLKMDTGLQWLAGF